MLAMRYIILAAFALSGAWCMRSSARHTVSLDLRHGVVTGYSSDVSFVVSPLPSSSTSCDSQAVVRINFSGANNKVRLVLDYERPRLWTLDVSDSPYGDGYGGDNGTTSNMAETQIFNKQLRIYGNSLPGYREASIDGGYLMRVVDNVVKHGRSFTLVIRDEAVEWSTGRRHRMEALTSPYLYTLSGQNTTHGQRDDDIFIGFNRVVAGNFRSGSGLCHVTIVPSEEHVPAQGNCRQGNQCHADATCYSTRRAVKCRCNDGYYGTGRICRDDDECAFLNGGCVHVCHNTAGNYSCSCMAGFTLDTDRHNCIDLDECRQARGACQHQCVNTVGSFLCRCNAGFTLDADGRRCLPASRCPRQLGCAHHCVSTSQGRQCACRDGYTRLNDGTVCRPTCAVGNGGCQHVCRDTAAGPVCSCNTNYLLRADNRTCVASCGVNNGGCDRRCLPSPAGPTCSCPGGFTLHADGRTCLDIDECSTDNGGCSNGCMNSVGSYECVCNKGYRIQTNRRTCADIDECSQNRTCDHQCINTDGSFLCMCNHGYESYGNTHCADLNECSLNNGGCQHDCVNADGSYSCRCRPNYKLHSNQKDCVAVSQCLELTNPARATMGCARSGGAMVCRVRCERPAVFLNYNASEEFVTRCGPDTGYDWTHALNNTTIPSCSESVLAPRYKRRFRFLFTADRCGKKKVRKRTARELQEQINPIVQGDTPRDCGNMCLVRFVNMECNTRQRRYRRLPQTRNRPLISAEFELQVRPAMPSGECDVECTRATTDRQVKRVMKRMRRKINSGRQRFLIRFENATHEIIRRSFKTSKAEGACPSGQILLGDTCVSCSQGLYYSAVERLCVPCPPGSYQDAEGELSCKPCPHRVPGSGVQGATSLQQCSVLCEPGTYSDTGYKPCRACSPGSYQTDHGRTSCKLCGHNILTRGSGARGFPDCLVPVMCEAGSFFSHVTMTCEVCPVNTYQSEAGQDYCVDCPGATLTDQPGATSTRDCKDHRCGWITTEYGGYIHSPNWPGPYPANVRCTWSIRPDKGRRLLVVIPEIFLAAEDQCGDSLVIRKSESPYSLTTYDTCESTDTPIAFTARTRRLWIEFNTDRNNSAKGFTIPYVTYDEEYQDLIEEIVRDGRLYSSYQHQQLLKDRELLTSLLEVIARPDRYFSIATDVHSILPASFLSLLQRKVRQFFDGGV